MYHRNLPVLPTGRLASRQLTPFQASDGAISENLHLANLGPDRGFLLQCMSPLMAQSGHLTVARQCPLLGVKQTWRFQRAMSAFDPKRTWENEGAGAHRLSC
jgi:hypothetical protein